MAASAANSNSSSISKKNVNPNWGNLLKTSYFLSYHQRIRIAFLAMPDEGSDEFSIQHFINKANSIIPYVGIVSAPKMTMFEIMDLFRVFDRSGDGFVSIDEFVTGVCVQIRLNIHNNTELLEKVAGEIDTLFTFDKTNAGKFLDARIDNFGDIQFLAPEYFKTFKYFDSFIRPSLKTYFQILDSQQSTGLTGSEIIFDFLKTGLIKLETQLLTYYHISYSVLKDVINSSSERRSGNIKEQGQIIIDERGLNQKSDYKNSRNRVLWNFQQSLVTKSSTRRDKKQQSQTNLNSNNDTESVMDESEILARNNKKPVILSQQLPSNLSHRQDLAKNITKLFQEIGFDGTDSSKQNLLNKSKKGNGGSLVDEQNVSGLLDYLAEVPHHSKHIIDDLDDSQLFLIQLAYRIIINFFHLQCIKTFNGDVKLSEAEGEGDSNADPNHALTTSLLRTLLPQRQNGSSSNNYTSGSSNNINNNDSNSNSNSNSKQNFDELKSIDESVNGGGNNIDHFLLAELLKTKQKLQKAMMKLEFMESVDIEDNGIGLEDYGNNYDELNVSRNSGDGYDGKVLGGNTIGRRNANKSGAEFADETSSKGDESATSGTKSYSFEDILGELESFKGSISCRMSDKMAAGSLMQEDFVLMNEDSYLLKEIKHYSDLIVENSAKDESSGEGSKLDFTPSSSSSSSSKSSAAMSNQEKQEFMRLQVQFQIMRAKVIAFQAESIQLEALKQQNNTLQNEVNELSLKLAGKTENDNIFEGIDRKQHFMNSEDDNFLIEYGGQLDGSGVGTDGGDDNIRDKFKKLAFKLEETSIKNDRLTKDNVRLNNHVKDSEMRIKNLLQEELDLNQQLTSAEDELNGCKVFIDSLLSQLEHTKSLQILQDSKNNTVAELKGEIVRRDAEIATLREEASLARRYKQELVSAEKVIETLESKLNDLLRESEHGIAAIEHLDSYRDQVRDLTKINRDSTLEIRRLETSLKSLNEFETDNKRLLRQNQEYRVQIEKIPGLLSEVARLRGSSRASMKALSEQDKLLAQLRNQIKALEKENVRIKINIRSNTDLQQSLKEANEEITRLMIVASEVNSLKAGAKNAEEEKKNMEGQFKKMKKIVRQSILIAKPPPPSTTVTDLSGNVDEIFSQNNIESAENSNSSNNDSGSGLLNQIKLKKKA